MRGAPLALASCFLTSQLLLRQAAPRAAVQLAALPSRPASSQQPQRAAATLLAAAPRGENTQQHSSPAAMAAEPEEWRSLGTPPHELSLDVTLPTGQSFRWRQTTPGTFTGVVGQRVVQLRQLPSDVEYRVLARGPGADAAGDAAVLHDYFNLGTSLSSLAEGWTAADARFAFVHPHFLGARVLRQDPVECLFEFICSSNNHIQRIHGMVERMCRQYGTPLLLEEGGSSAPSALAPPSAAAECSGEAAPAGNISSGASSSSPLELYAFPTIQQLAAASEEELRSAGFGYRAKYVTGSAAMLADKPGGGAAWLAALREVPYGEAVEALVTLPGVGPKVAACICLFSLDKHQAIPVDTHVWQLACRYYTPHLKGKALTKKVHVEVQEAFEARFGAYAGWAHTILFIAELPVNRGRLPSGGSGKAAARPSEQAEEEEEAEIAAAAVALAPATPPKLEGCTEQAGAAGATGGQAAPAGKRSAKRRGASRAAPGPPRKRKQPVALEVEASSE